MPPVQYAIMIDAGSTGSRVHIYQFSNCGPSLTLSNEIFNETKPGLSFYKSNPKAAASSLDKLLQEALQVVPKHLQKCTPIEVKATAGLRLLGTDLANSILKEVRRKLEDEYPFFVPDNPEAVAVMDGKDEGVFAWITVNYLLNCTHLASKQRPNTSLSHIH